MAGLIQLDKAAAMVGKSEVTLRRLIKAGRIPYHKEKTLTGFIYQVDPDVVKQYYSSRDGEIFAAVAEEPPRVEEVVVKKGSAQEEPKSSSVRVAIAGESTSGAEYWQKKAESYEERFNAEVGKHAQTREDLGVWRGRAEQAQAMLIKLLPTPTEVEVQEKPTTKEVVAESSGIWSTVVVVVLALLLVAAGLALFYLKFIAGK